MMEPELAEGCIRLYRSGELPRESKYYGIKEGTPAFAMLGWLGQGMITEGFASAVGRWFTPHLSNVEWYAKDREETKLHYLDLPIGEAAQWLVENNPIAKQFSADHANEYFLPVELANLALLMPGYIPDYMQNKSGAPMQSMAQEASAVALRPPRLG